MNVKFLFEDKYNTTDINSSTPSSILLKSCLNGDNIFFSGGNELLETKLASIYNTQDFFIIFIDVVPNNPALVTLYKTLNDKIETNGWSDNVKLLPIPCIEYYIIDMLSVLGVIFTKEKQIQDLYNNLYLKINWNNIPKEKQLISIEKLYKEIINLQKPYCLRNSNKNKHDYYGDFYKTSCKSCTGKKCTYFIKDKEIDYTLDFKSNFLYTGLPIFNVNKSEIVLLEDMGIVIEEKSGSFEEVIEETKEKLQDFYDDMCKEVNQVLITVF